MPDEIPEVPAPEPETPPPEPPPEPDPPEPPPEVPEVPEIPAGEPLPEPEPIEHAPYVLSREEVRAARRAAYQEEADGLMADFVAGLVDKTVWEAKRAEIKARFPMPEVGE